ncbi:MAG: hypothetical protein RH946_07405 [Rhodospirillales bacterium]
MPRIGIITGVKTEEAALSPVMHDVDAPYVRLSGARPGRAVRGIETLIALGVDGILSFGTAGGVSSGRKPGDLIVADRVIDADTQSYPTDPAWSHRLSSLLSVTPETIAGLDYIADNDDKIRLAGEGIAALDMESHTAGRLAADAGIPFAVLRAVVDPAGFTMPNYVLDSVRPDGSISLIPIIAGLCVQPWTIGPLLDLNSYNKKAMESLSSASRTLGPGFGLFAI